MTNDPPRAPLEADRRRARGSVAGDAAPARVRARRRRTRRLRRCTLRHRHRGLPIPASSKQKTLATRRGSLRSSVVRRLASVPPRSSVLPPGAGNKPEKAVQPKKERAKNPDERRVVEAGVHWHGQAAAVGRHDDGNMAAITAVEHAQSVLPQNASRVRLPGSRGRSLRGDARSRNPPHPTAPHRGRTPTPRGSQPARPSTRVTAAAQLPVLFLHRQREPMRDSESASRLEERIRGATEKFLTASQPRDCVRRGWARLARRPRAPQASGCEAP